MGREGKLVPLYERMRVKIADHRPDVPRDAPFVPPFNRYSANVPGTTYFLPVAEMTTLCLNLMLSAFSEDLGYFVVDERNRFAPAGAGKFARSKGGHLNDDLASGRVATLGMIETWLCEFVAVRHLFRRYDGSPPGAGRSAPCWRIRRVMWTPSSTSATTARTRSATPSANAPPSGSAERWGRPFTPALPARRADIAEWLLVRVAIIGGGIPAAVQAWAAVLRGHTVTQFDDGTPAAGSGALRAGSVAAVELGRAVEAVRGWHELGGRVPAVGFRPSGSITLVRTSAELAVAEAAASGPEAAAREWTLLEPSRVRALEPAVRGPITAGLHCGLDGVLTPAATVAALRAQLAGTGRFTARGPARALTESAGGVTVDGDVAVDAALLCPGPGRDALARELTGAPPEPVVRAQLLRTAPLTPRPDAVLTDGDDFRHRPGYPAEPVARLTADQAQAAAAAAYGMHVLAVPRLDGGLTLGATRETEQPFPLELAEPAADHLLTVARDVLGTRPRVLGRWAEVHYDDTPGDRPAGSARSAWFSPSPRILVLRNAGPDATLLAPALAEEAAELLGRQTPARRPAAGWDF